MSLGTYLFAILELLKSIVAVNSKRTFCELAANILLTVFSQELISSLSSFESCVPDLVSTLI